MKVLLFQVCFWVNYSAFTQNLLLRGQVKDEKGHPISYVSIISKKFTTGTACDEEGYFNLLIKKDDVLKFTCVGYSMFEYTVKDEGYIEIELNKTSYTGGSSFSRQIGFWEQPSNGGKLLTETLKAQSVEIKQWLQSKNDEKRFFEKVEIGPVLYGKVDSLVKDISKEFLQNENKVLLQFIITKDKRIDSIQVLKMSNQKIGNLVVTNLKTFFKPYPAMQNGRFVSVSCRLNLEITKKDDAVIVLLKKD